MAAPVKQIEGAVAEAKGRWTRLQKRFASIRHIAEAWGLMNRARGNQFAAAITYFSFLALFPLLLLGVSVLGFVLHAHPALLQSVLNHITDQIPGEFGRTLKTALKDAIAARAQIGLIGLAGVLLTGLGWVANLRSAIDAIWMRPPVQRNWLTGRLADLLVLAGLGLGILLSVGLTVLGTSATDQALSALGADHLPGARLLVKVLGVLLALVGDVIIYGWLMVRLPDVEVSKRIELRGALLAAVSFEVLKVVGSYTIAHTSGSLTAGPFAGIVAVLVWIQLVARALLLSCAWTAVLAAEETRARLGPVPESILHEGARPRRAEGVLLDRDARTFGRGAAVGAAVAWVLTRSHLASGRARK